MKRLLTVFLALGLLLAAVPAMASDYQYISAKEVKQKMDANEKMHILDIQVEDEYKEHHLPGAMGCMAYPVKSDEEKAKVQAYVDKLQQDEAPVVVVCPRGKGGAERTYDYLKTHGVDEQRLFILTGGQGGWPYPVEKGE